MTDQVSVIEVLRQCVSALDGVERAFIFGSEARGDARPDSDIDVLIIVQCKNRPIIELSAATMLKIGREVNAINYKPHAWQRLLDEGNGFATRVEAGQKIMLIGD